MTKILLVRHGESEANGKGFFAGQIDIPLSERGKLQAQKTSGWICEHYSVDKIYASDLQRAYGTAQALADRLGMEIESRKSLREINAGEWQGKSFDELEKDYAESYGVWLKDIGRAQTKGGESVQELYDRVQAELVKIARENEGKTVVVATHATPIRALYTFVQGIPVADMKNTPWASNASVTEIRFENDRFWLYKFSVDEYLSGLQTSFPANV